MSAVDGFALTPIGVVHSPFTEQPGTPIQSVHGHAHEGSVVVHPAYRAALLDLAGFARIWLLVWYHRSGRVDLQPVPYRDTVPHGLFATRAPARPNPLGISCPELLAVEGDSLRIRGVDLLDGTPVLDIKPYVPEFDAFPDCRAGWLDAQRSRRTRADDRFVAD